MTELAVMDKGGDWRQLKALVLDHETGLQPGPGRVVRMVWPGTRTGFTKATVAAWRVRAGGLGLRGYLMSQLDAACCVPACRFYDRRSLIKAACR